MFKYLYRWKRIAAVGVVVCLLIFFASGSLKKSEPVLYPDFNGLTVYLDFINHFKSGQVTKYRFGLDTPYNFLNASKETIIFKIDDFGRQTLTYQKRNPILFWDHPTPSYYDGAYYYYRYKDDWFTDSTGRYDDLLEQEYMGIPMEMFIDYSIVKNAVYQIDDHYQMLVILSDDENGRVFVIKGYLDKDLKLQTLLICDSRARDFDMDNYTVSDSLLTDLNTYTRYTYIAYDDVNAGNPVKPPKNLPPSQLNYWQNDAD